LPLQGNSTDTVKQGMEYIADISYIPVSKITTVAVTAANTGTATANADYSLPATGADYLFVRMNTPCKSNDPIVVTVTGTGDDANPFSATATIPARSEENASIEMTVSTGNLLASGTTVTFTGGVAGDEFEIRVHPPVTSFSEPTAANIIGFFRDWNDDPGPNTRLVHDGFEPDHKKRIRRQNAFSAKADYTSHNRGFSRYAGQDVTLRLRANDDGRASTTETLLFDQADFNSPTAVTDEGNSESNPTGTYIAKCAFS